MIGKFIRVVKHTTCKVYATGFDGAMLRSPDDEVFLCIAEVVYAKNDIEFCTAIDKNGVLVDIVKSFCEEI